MQAQQAPTFVYCSRILFLPFHQLLVIHKDNLTQPKKKKMFNWYQYAHS